jgi:hypothetical protein
MLDFPIGNLEIEPSFTLPNFLIYLDCMEAEPGFKGVDARLAPTDN